MRKNKRRKKQSGEQPKAEHEGKEPPNNWGKILEGTIHSITSGWIQNLGIGLVLLLLGPAIGTIMNKQKLVILSAAIGLCLLILIVALIMIRQLSPARPDPFSVEIELAALSEKRGFWGNRFYVGYKSGYGDTLSPADVTMFIKIVNLQQVPSMIERFRVNIKLGDHEWMRLVHLPLRGNSVFWVGPEALQKAIGINPANGLDYLLAEKSIQPHEPIRGWAYLEVPKDYSAPDGTIVQYRVEIQDAAGISFEYSQPGLPATKKTAPPGNSDQIQSMPWLVLPGYRDVSLFHLRYCNQPID